MNKLIDGTFKSNMKISMHRWYPYVEGFSESFVKSILDELGLNKGSNKIVYDPFNGSGTTTLTCSYNGLYSIGSEINPLMRFISEVKVNTSINIIRLNKLNLLEKEINNIKKSNINNFTNIDVAKFINSCYIDKEFFIYENLREIGYIKKQILNIEDKDILNIMKLALASILVSSSNMIRATDLRRRKGKEIERVEKPFDSFINKLIEIYNDLKRERQRIMEMEYMSIIDYNAKKKNKNYKNIIDLVITSPPYINGTNYFRNTKLELWILDFINKESDLKMYRGEAITAGINNVSARIDNTIELDFVKQKIKEFDKVSKVRKIDKRIPKMIEAYFSDMYKVFNSLNYMMKDGSKIYFDMGDSQYYGIYIPVYEYIIEVAKLNGFNHIETRKIRDRRSNSGLKLSQKLLIFEKSN